MLSEEASLCDAAGVEGGKDDASLVVITSMQLLHQHHIADLAVLVRLCTIKLLAVQHCDRGFHAFLQSLQVSYVSQRRDHATQLRTVHSGGDSAQDHAAGRLGGASLEVLQQQVAEQEVSQVVRRKAHLVTLCRPARTSAREETREEDTLLVGVRVVHGRVAHQSIQRPPQRLEGFHEVADAVRGGQVTVEHLIRLLEHASISCSFLCLLIVPARHDHVPVARGGELLRRRQTQPR
mmetsp:Transcript_5333/g.10889  ORF Transcript_5333/g.10889 Transcript_5333/m.10889 type:complete len:236 (+) Transcript_5333:589-1296(+)